MEQDAPRWLEITPSQFSHEAESLARIRKLLPDAAPFRAWSNFEFRDGHGKWHEVDLLVLGRRRLHLVELKAYRGTLQGDDHRWRRDGKRAEDSPLKLARRKAQRLASKLQDELLRWAKENNRVIPDVRDVVPFVQESVYLHHEQFRCELPPSARIDLFGLDGQTANTNLPGIRERLLEPTSGSQSFKDAIIAQLMHNIGVVQRRQREAGSWVIDEEPTDEGDGWQDWPAFHRVSNDRARIHFLVTAPGAATAEVTRTRTLGQHEYRVMQRLQHEGLLSPRDIVDNDLGVGLVYPADERFQRLDLWLADKPQGIPVLTQLAILRKVAETVAYAHDNSVVHRGLTPQAVHVRETVEQRDVKVLVGDWQSAGTTRSATTTAGPGVTGLLGAEQPSTVAERLHSVMNPADADRRAAEAFQAPEGVWNTQAQRVPLDVFALGALAYFILAGRPAAPDRAALRERVRRDGGLDLAADLPQVSSAVRALVLEATRPAVSERLADVPRFLELLAAAERSLAAAPEDDVDALDAAPGAVLAGRFELVRRLGAGSTAVGLLVLDHELPESGDRTRVLKVALHDAAAARLGAEAEVLQALKAEPRVVRLVEGPIQLGARQALVLESAGEETLAEVLRGRARLSLDLLERWGADLLLALAALDKAGVDHRDIKPANLGVRRDSRGRKSLVLFDFSLSRAGASAVTAGTPPYLDPFLERTGRGRYDSAAERYSAAVVLFEMSTGTATAYGDGLSDPMAVDDEATVTPSMFDPSAADGLQSFFTTALARDATARFDTAAEMLAAWRSVFTPLPTTVPDDADTLVDAVEATTALTASGLSARALSALEPYGVQTVGELVALDPVRLNRISGVAEPTRKEVKARFNAWRARLGGTRGAAPAAQGDLPDPITAAERLLVAVGSAKAEKLRAAASKILGLDGTVDAFASQQEIATASGVTRARIAQQVPVMQTAWSQDDASRTLLDAVLQVARNSLTALGGVATVDELTRAVLDALPPSTATSDGPSPERVAAGLLRVAYDRAHELDRADDDDAPLATRRRGGRIAVVASDPALLDAADALGQAADALVATARAAGEPVVPTARATEQLTATLSAVLPANSTLDGTRALRLAAALAGTAELSGALELHHRELPPTDALALALAGVGGRAELTVREVRDRVRARFPALPPLPGDERLALLVQQTDLALEFVDGVFRSRVATADTTGLESRHQTRTVAAVPQLVAGGHVGHRLTESARSRSFLALGVEARRADTAAATLVRELDAHVVDLTRVLLDSLRAQADQVGIPWDAVRAADAEAEGTRGAQGLAQLVTQALPAVDAAITAACDGAPAGTRPVLLTEAAPLARYGHLGTLSRWTDLATPRTQAVWLLVPQLHATQGAVVDTRPLPLAAPGQYLRLDADWLDSRTPSTSGAHP